MYKLTNFTSCWLIHRLTRGCCNSQTFIVCLLVFGLNSTGEITSGDLSPLQCRYRRYWEPTSAPVTGSCWLWIVPVQASTSVRKPHRPVHEGEVQTSTPAATRNKHISIPLYEYSSSVVTNELHPSQYPAVLKHNEHAVIAGTHKSKLGSPGGKPSRCLCTASTWRLEEYISRDWRRQYIHSLELILRTSLAKKPSRQ